MANWTDDDILYFDEPETGLRGREDQHDSGGSGFASGFLGFVEGMKNLPSTIMARGLDVARGQEGIEAVPDPYISEVDARNQQIAEEYGSDDVAFRVPFTDLKVTARDIATAPQNLAYSGISMAAGLGSGALTSAASGGNVALGYGAGMLASGAIAYRMASSEAARTYRDHLNAASISERGRPLSQQEWDTLSADFEEKASRYGLWEAIPEALGNAVGFGIITAPAKKLLGNRIASNLVSKYGGTIIGTAMGIGARAGGELGEELLTETITSAGIPGAPSGSKWKGQAGIEAEVGIRDRDISFGEGFDEVFGPTVLTTAILGPGAAGAKVGYDKIRGKKPSDETDILNTGMRTREEAIRDNALQEIYAGLESGEYDIDTVKEIRDGIANQTGEDIITKSIDDIFFNPGFGTYQRNMVQDASVNYKNKPVTTGLAGRDAAIYDDAEAEQALIDDQDYIEGQERYNAGMNPEASQPPAPAVNVPEGTRSPEEYRALAEENKLRKMRMQPPVSQSPFPASGLRGRDEMPEPELNQAPIMPNEVGQYPDEDPYETLDMIGPERVPDRPAPIDEVEPYGDEPVYFDEETEIDDLAHEAAPSPLNDRQEPTEGVIEPGTVDFRESKVSDIVGFKSTGYHQIVGRQIRTKREAREIAERENGEIVRDLPKGGKDTWAVWKKAEGPKQSAPTPKLPKASTKGANVRTLRGAIKGLGGINFLNFTGELRDMDRAVKFLSRKDGMPIDVAEQALRDDGWLGEDESLLELLRDPESLKRDRITRDLLDKPDNQLSDKEKQIKGEMEWEPEEPPPGNYVQMDAQDLPEGKELTIIDGNSTDGWDTYKVIEKDPFGITLQDGTIIELSPFDKVEVLEDDLKETPSATDELKDEFIKYAAGNDVIGQDALKEWHDKGPLYHKFMGEKHPDKHDLELDGGKVDPNKNKLKDAPRPTQQGLGLPDPNQRGLFGPTSANEAADEEKEKKKKTPVKNNTTNQSEEFDIDEIADLYVEVEYQEAETGKKYRVNEPAAEALNNVDKDIESLYAILECVL